MTKILFLIPTLMHGGAEKVLVNLVNNLEKEKYDTTLYSIFDKGVNKEFLNKNIRYQYKFKKIFRGNSQLMKLFSPKILYHFFIKEDYDIVISFLEGPAARIIAGCPNPKTRKIAWIHTDFTDETVAQIGFRNLSEARKYYGSFNVIAGVSKNVLSSFHKMFDVVVPKVILYNIIETDLIKLKGSEPIDDFDDKFGPIFCSVGKIVNVKGFDRLLEVHRRLINEGYSHQINILGMGEDQTDLERKIANFGLQNSFKLLGFHINPYKYMSKCDWYICASHREGFSTAVSEALILGIPVISTDCSGAKELLGEHNEYGLVTENSTEGIYQAMKQVLENGETFDFYKEQVKKRGAFFSKENTITAVEDLLDKLV